MTPSGTQCRQSFSARLLKRAVPSVLAAAIVTAVGFGCAQEVKTKPVPPRWQPLPAATGLPEFVRGTLLDRCLRGNDTPYLVSTYGLVGQLRGTGDCTAPTSVRSWMIKEMTRRGFGDSLIPGYGRIMPADVLKDKNYAIVTVQGEIPPGARKGDWIDVRVNALPSPNTTTSLAHGSLFECDLRNDGADRNSPGGGIHTLVVAKGPVMVNPAYALDTSVVPTGPAKTSLRQGTVMFNGVVKQDRPIFLQLRQPDRRISRAVEARINERFQDTSIAAAQDEAIVQVYVPKSYRGDWEHFIGVVQHLWLESSTDFNIGKAKQLVEEAKKPGAPLENISYCWEGLGKDALPFIQPLLTSTNPELAFAAARAAVFIGDPSGSAEEVLIQIASRPLHPFRISAVQTLGQLPASSALNHRLRPLLDSDQATVRIEAYKVLARNQDTSIYSSPIAPTLNAGNQKFILDIVPTDGPPMIYCTQRGAPRIALMGRPAELHLPVTLTAMDNKFTVSSSTGKDRVVTLFHRDPMRREPVKVFSDPDLSRIVARLGGQGPRDEASLDLTYGEIVAILQKLTESGQVVATDGPRLWPVAFMLQEARPLQGLINTAPVIGAAQPGPAPRPDLADAARPDGAAVPR